MRWGVEGDVCAGVLRGMCALTAIHASDCV